MDQQTRLTAQEAQDAREKYVMAFNKTMVTIWQEQITLLGVIDTGALLHSVTALSVDADGRFVNVHLSQAFLEYGLWQDYGTGKEVPRGNGGDIGRTKVRERRQWFSRKYYASVMNIRDFYGESLGQEFCGVLSDALSEKVFRRKHT